ncbi:enoyl-CoA hydratase/isomerase family protein [Pseudohoeflea coraliihabitans]|uniref:Enoyl-CoA hydratase/isomerase family protein n=1 Tax=Pseudohoeflea coraliihabitans TaxID=2860393 RepID=A0ABS6WQN0_9HYPH|nr:enoyl-CoA hydratase/isomerase family protein [Pseudohoeflea sp. DP4N28-3]
MSEDKDILIKVEGRVGHVTLNRPKALNALTYDMVLALEEALDAWRDDPDIAMVLIDAAGDKAFCAGGDIQAMYRHGKDGDYDYARRFWADEYRLNAKIAGYAKPFVALMHGIVMGGGVGLSAHGRHRIVTDTTMLAMPECAIGLIPDVGGTFLLARARGRLGEYLGLTGTRLGAADAIYAGFADSYVPLDRLEALRAALLDSGDPAVIEDFAGEPPEGRLAAIEVDVDEVFEQGSALDCLRMLESRDEEWAAKAAKAIRGGSPISLACTFEMVRASRTDLTLEDSLKREYRFSSRCMEHGDFLEGIRAAVIDKDRQPKFSKPGLEAVTQEDVASMLAEPPGGDIEL